MTGDIQSRPLVSVILPTYNRARLLRRSIESVLGQDFRDLELIVVDDGSTDETGALMASISDPRVRYIRLPRNSGVSAARNAGIRAAAGEFLAFNDSDDTWLPEKLSLQMSTLGGLGADYGLLISGIRRGKGDNIAHLEVVARRNPPEVSRAEVLSSPSRYLYVQTWLARRSTIYEAGGFDESLTLWEDWELLIRLSQQCRIGVHPYLTVISDWFPDSVTKGKHWAQTHAHIIGKHRNYLEQYRRSFAELLYGCGRQQLLQCQHLSAVVTLSQALLRDPIHRRAWLLLLLACVGGGAIFRRMADYKLRSWKRQMDSQ